MKISTLEIPHTSDKTATFKLIAGHNSYQLLDTHGRQLLQGQIGKLSRTTTETNQPIAILVSELRANPGTEFTVTRDPLTQTISDLEKKIIISDFGDKKSNNMPTGLLKVSLTGADPNKIVLILNTMANIALQKDYDNKLQEASKTLAFLEQQLVP